MAQKVNPMYSEAQNNSKDNQIGQISDSSASNKKKNEAQ